MHDDGHEAKLKLELSSCKWGVYMREHGRFRSVFMFVPKYDTHWLSSSVPGNQTICN